MRTKKLWRFCSSVLVVALTMNMCSFSTLASNTEGNSYLLSTPSNAQEHEEIENDIIATPSDLTNPEKVVQYDPQPKSLEEVQELIDTYNASFADEPIKPHWEFLVEEELMPEGYYCALMEEDEEFGADYYTFSPAVAIRTMALNNGWDGTIATSQAYVKNLNLIDVEISGSIHVGGIAGKCEDINIENCTVSGTISGNKFVGGMIGEQGQYSNLINSMNYANVSGNSYVGGIAGIAGILKESINYGEITGQTNVGGIAGVGSTIQSCGNFGPVIGTGDNVGGIIGKLSGYNNRFFKNN